MLNYLQEEVHVDEFTYMTMGLLTVAKYSSDHTSSRELRLC